MMKKELILLLAVVMLFAGCRAEQKKDDPVTPEVTRSAEVTPSELPVQTDGAEQETPDATAAHPDGAEQEMPDATDAQQGEAAATAAPPLVPSESVGK